MRRSRRRGRKSGNTAALKIMVALLVIALFGVGGMAVYAYNNYRNNSRMMRAVVVTDRIHRNIFINGVNVGGMTREAAELTLRREFIPALQENTVAVTAGEHQLEFNFGEFGARFDFSEAVEQAYRYGKTGSLRDRYRMITDLEETPYHIEFTPVYTYDRGNITQMLEPLRDAVNIEPLSASIERRNGQFIL
ncbi:MAG: peptidoglycan binding domain-containing protein, partial [Defluviitaleaceae bacterium]|nr:peptidoglycan binding domain-containing protein [Defluviitaleaceae bacterium]